MKTAMISVSAIALAALLTACGGGAAPMSNATTGAIAGSVIGGVVGHQFGDGDGQTAATVLGTVAGGYIGGQMGANADRPYYPQQPQTYYRPY